MGIFDRIKVNVSFGNSTHGNGNTHNPHNKPHGNHDKHGHGHGSDEYFAVIEQGGLFFSGEMPDIKWGKVSLCKTYDELINGLTKKLNEEIEKAIKWSEPLPVRTSYNEIAVKYPGKKIVGIRPTIRY